jgi:adenylylsulfate kinase
MAEELYITEQKHKTGIADRVAKNGHAPACLWFTGLSGSGKSTLANLVEQQLFELGFHTYILDGDNVRKGLNNDLDFTDEGRTENIRRIGEVVKLMCDAGLVVLAAFISPFINDREKVKNLMGDNFVEIFVDAPVQLCEQRDTKGLYKKARAGQISNFTGISSPFEVPLHPDVHIQTGKQSIGESVSIIINHVLPKLKL